jgi:palmitoyltransferase ZDHHC13/17
MRSHIDGINHVTPSSQAITSALAAGTTSLDSAGLSAAGRGPNSTLASASGPRQRHGCFKQWKRLLGLDTFLATAQAGFGDRRRSSRQKNPFSRGIITNCRDFWGDPAPIFGKREPGLAMLGGEVVNYYRMYETPLRMHSSSRGGSEATYRSLAGEDPEEMV